MALTSPRYSCALPTTWLSRLSHENIQARQGCLYTVCSPYPNRARSACFDFLAVKSINPNHENQLSAIDNAGICGAKGVPNRNQTYNRHGGPSRYSICESWPSDIQGPRSNEQARSLAFSDRRHKATMEALQPYCKCVFAFRPGNWRLIAL
jgi:hypothetical protein